MEGPQLAELRHAHLLMKSSPAYTATLHIIIYIYAILLAYPVDQKCLGIKEHRGALCGCIILIG